MSAASLTMERTRNGLSEAIVSVLKSWPLLERQVFTQSHYRGESAEHISVALGLSVSEVRSILEQCNTRLRKSLKGFRLPQLSSLHGSEEGDSEYAAHDYLC